MFRPDDAQRLLGPNKYFKNIHTHTLNVSILCTEKCSWLRCNQESDVSLNWILLIFGGRGRLMCCLIGSHWEATMHCSWAASTWLPHCCEVRGTKTSNSSGGAEKAETKSYTTKTKSSNEGRKVTVDSSSAGPLLAFWGPYARCCLEAHLVF